MKMKILQIDFKLWIYFTQIYLLQRKDDQMAHKLSIWMFEMDISFKT